MNLEARQVMQLVAGVIVVLAAVAAVTIFVYDNVTGRSVDIGTTALLSLLVSFALTALGYTGGAANTTQATDKANANSAQVITAANGNAHEVFASLNPGVRFATVPGAVGAKPVGQPSPAPLAVSQPDEQPVGEAAP